MRERIFFSHSGPISKAHADIFYEWLHLQIPLASRWMSNHDINKGTNWNNELQTALKKSFACLVFLTSENKGSDWIIYETAKAEAYEVDIYPILIDLSHEDVDFIFKNYQHTFINKNDLEKLAISINNNAGGSVGQLPLKVVKEYFRLIWPELERSFRTLRN